MDYYQEMIKEYVLGEIKKSQGRLMDDGEFCFACGLAMKRFGFTLSMVQEYNEKHGNSEKLSSLIQLKKAVVDLGNKQLKDQKNVSRTHIKLFKLIKEYEPEQETLDFVLIDLLKKGIFYEEERKNRKLEPEGNGQKSSSVIAKTYRLEQKVVEDFSAACDRKGVRLGAQLMLLMRTFIDSVEQSEEVPEQR